MLRTIIGKRAVQGKSVYIYICSCKIVSVQAGMTVELVANI